MPNILIVDDEAAIRESLRGVLDDEGTSGWQPDLPIGGPHQLLVHMVPFEQR